jgi:hypothetical protein
MPRDRAGRSTAIAVITPVRPIWAAWLRLDFALLRIFKRLIGQREPSRPVRKLSFINFAHWAVARRVGDRSLPYAYLVFQSNFNGAAPEYFEAFARGLKWRMRGLWGGAYGMPDPANLIEFSEWIRDHWIHASHYYSAYPHASTKIILSALEVTERFIEFARRVPSIEPDRFRDEFERFIASVQGSV